MQYDYEKDSVLFAGMYDEADNTIYISYGLRKAATEVVYYHEREHRECFLRGCFCYKHTSNFWAEYHAYTGELKSVIARNNRSVTKAYFLSVVLSLIESKKHPKVWLDNSRALRRVMRTRLYKEFERREFRRKSTPK
jgi:hypothetical protein